MLYTTLPAAGLVKIMSVRTSRSDPVLILCQGDHPVVEQSTLLGTCVHCQETRLTDFVQHKINLPCRCSVCCMGGFEQHNVEQYCQRHGCPLCHKRVERTAGF